MGEKEKKKPGSVSKESEGLVPDVWVRLLGEFSLALHNNNKKEREIIETKKERLKT